MLSKSFLFSFIGKVQKHRCRGRTLGYPTANVMVSQDTPEGIFVGYLILDKVKRPSLIFVGSPLTFGETDKRAEMYIFDFNDNIYGKEVTVEVLKKMRNNKKFDSPEKLIEQMKRDEKQGREFFSTLKKELSAESH